MERALTRSDEIGTCVRQLSKQPSSWMIQATGAIAAGVIGGPLGAVLAAVVVMGLLSGLVHSRSFRTAVQDADARRRHAVRARRRTRMLENADVPVWRLAQLAQLAREIARRNPRDAEVFDLEGLMDHYVALECEQQRVEQSIANLDVGPLTRILDSDPDARSPRRQIIERRLALWNRARARAAELAVAIQTTTELVYLIAQRAEQSDPEIDTGRIDACLEQLAAEDELVRDLERSR